MLHRLARQPPQSRTALDWVQGALRRLPGRPLAVHQLWLLRFNGVPQPDARHLRGPAAVRIGTPADADGMSRCEGKNAEVFLRRFETSDLCVVAEVERRIIGYAWYTVVPSYHDSHFGFSVPIPADAVFGYDGFIVPEHRLTGVWWKLQGFLGSWMKATGKAAVLSTVEHSNRGSLVTHLRFGFEPHASLWLVRILGRTFSFQRPVR